MPAPQPRGNIGTQTTNAMDFALILEYFERSPFDYLDIEASGHAVRLDRARTADGVNVSVEAPGIGTIVPFEGDALPAVGSRVEAGQVLFALHRFTTRLEVVAPSTGTITALDAAAGQFVEYGQTLASIAIE